MNIYTSNRTSYWDLEKCCEEEFTRGGPYWHLCSDGNYQKIIFTNESDFKIAMNCIAFCVLECNVRIIAFVIMNNHVHFILEGTKDDAILFFKRFKLRMLRCFGHLGKSFILKNFDCGNPISITSLQALRNEIAYIHRNPFVARYDMLPHCYQWGSGCLYFNKQFDSIETKAFTKLSFREKRALHTSTRAAIPGKFRIRNGYIIPESYLDIARGERFFRHASHYYNLLTKNIEAFSEVSKALGDKICLNDEEIFSAAYITAKAMFGVERVQLLVGDQLRTVAIELHTKYGATNKQIARVLKLTIDQVNQLFPQRE